MASALVPPLRAAGTGPHPCSRTVWIGPLRDPTGYADEGRGFLRAMTLAGHAPAARPLDSQHRIALTADDQSLLDAALARGVDAPGIAVHHYQPGPWQPELPQFVNVARTMFETDRIPAEWLQPLRNRELIWVPCTHNAEAFAASGVPEEKLRVLCGSLDFDLFRPGVEPWDLGAPKDHRVFLTMFDFQERKGWRELLEAWGLAFTRDDGVCLVLKTGSYFRGNQGAVERIHAFLRERFGARVDRLAPIHIVTDIIDAPDMPRLYAAADAYVLPTRGEGWGRTQMEALACGVPTVTSRWSGVMEFMEDESSWLVDGELVPVPEEDELFGHHKGHRWFAIDVEALAEALREIAADPVAARDRAALARPGLIERFSPAAIGARLEELCDEALELHGERRARPVSAVVSRLVERVLDDGFVDELRAAGENAILHFDHAPGLKTDAPFLTVVVPQPGVASVTDGPVVAVLPRAAGRPPAEWLLPARKTADRVWVADRGTIPVLLAAGIPAGTIEVLPEPGEDVAAWVRARLAELAAAGEPLARDIEPTCIERRERAVLYAPDWDAHDRWPSTVARWSEVVSEADPVTLVLAAPRGETARVLERLAAGLAAHGRSLEALPDVVLAEHDECDLPGLVAATDAVLLDEPGDLRPAYRRARAALLSGRDAIADWLTA
jgi:glycosyltransferase involved in cell wall biosynthesis